MGDWVTTSTAATSVVAPPPVKRPTMQASNASPPAKIDTPKEPDPIGKPNGQRARFRMLFDGKPDLTKDGPVCLNKDYVDRKVAAKNKVMGTGSHYRAVSDVKSCKSSGLLGRPAP